MKLEIVGPVFPYRAGIAYCTTRLAEELGRFHDVSIHSFSRQFPRLFYPGSDDRDASLASKTPRNATFAIDVMNPLTWIRAGLRLRRARPDVVIFTWWVWVWALPYLMMRAFLPPSTRVVYQCHNITDKEPSFWKSWLTTRALASADLLVIHARSEADEARRRLKGGRDPRIEEIFLPVHEMGGEVPSRTEARKALGVDPGRAVALFFGHVRPFKALDIVLDAWPKLQNDVLLLVAGEVWYGGEAGYREQRRRLELDDRRVRFDFRFIPDSEIATWFAAADLVLAPYRHEAQSGVVLTAFHFGRPVIATRVGGMPEIVENGVNGLLIEPESAAALAEAIDRFLTSCNREAMENAAKASAARYSWHEFAVRLMRALHS
ncbi:MAG: glycosyltransferase family 4 protein [Acidobacteria bacterium]|nr:glycosyltransferase family 4 protein [Acidobacteriota bacterium]